jgi:F0F1-type ATP synthase gamma subunit
MQVVTTVRWQRLKGKHQIVQRYLRPMQRVLAGRGGEEGVALSKILVVLRASRGLCGNFNAAVQDRAEKFVRGNPGTQTIVLGAEDNRGLFKKIFRRDAEVYVVYNALRGGANFDPRIYRLAPWPEELAEKKAPEEMLLEPAPGELINAMAEHYIEARFYQLLLNSQIGEMMTRLMVLNNAVENSKDLISSLQLSINKMRQAAITQELSEVVSSAETMRSGLDE